MPIELSFEERRRLARELVEQLEREAHEWVENDDRRIVEAHQTRFPRERREQQTEPNYYKNVSQSDVRRAQETRAAKKGKAK